MESLKINKFNYNEDLSLNVVTYRMRMIDEAEKHLTKIYEDILEMESKGLKPKIIIVSKPIAEAIAVKNYNRLKRLDIEQLFGIQIVVNGKDKSINSYVLSDNETEMFNRKI